jgi:hypothetical protein
MYSYTFVDWFDDDAANAVTQKLKKKLEVGDIFNINDVTFSVEHIEYTDKKKAKALIRMRRYKIGNTQTQFVHKCPAKRDMMGKLSREDVIRMEENVGKKQVDSWKKGRVKLNSYNKKEIICPECKTVFWKEYDDIPDTVEVTATLNKKVLRKRK